MNNQPVSYLQTDRQWANQAYAVKGETATVGGSGCGPTAMAMVLATWADPKVTPGTECAWALAHGYKALNHGTFYGYFAPAAARYGLSCSQINYASLYGNASSSYHTQVKKALAAGDMVIACMGPGNWTRSGHFVLVWALREDLDIVYINDPASTLTRRTRGSWKLFRSQVKYYFIIKRPAKAPAKKEESTMTDAEIKTLIEETVRTTVQNVLPGLLKEAVQGGITAAKNETALAAEPGWSQSEGGWSLATELGVFDGTRPRSPLTRAEAAATFLRMGLLSRMAGRDGSATETAEKLGMD